MKHIALTNNALTSLVGDEVAFYEIIGGGRNSRVYRAACHDGRSYAVKQYFRHLEDKRDRVGTEFYGLRFLWDNGIRNVPYPIRLDKNLDCAVYEYLDGTRMLSYQASGDDIDTMVNFLTELNKLSKMKEPNNLPRASEACFTIRDVIENVSCRSRRLSSGAIRGSQYSQLREFMVSKFFPLFKAVQEYCFEQCVRFDIEPDRELPREERTLSPSDFGFHNALRLADGRIFFLDFEYFGWDDPAKMISDFILHPGMELCDELKKRFVAGIMSRLSGSERIAQRVAVLCPLFGMKWCLILLNEFIPADLERRWFAGQRREIAELQAEQMAKAERMLGLLQQNYQNMLA